MLLSRRIVLLLACVRHATDPLVCRHPMISAAPQNARFSSNFEAQSGLWHATIVPLRATELRTGQPRGPCLN
jgi:hypothetical protein